MEDGHFGEDVAATYDQSEGPEFEPAVVAATVGFLAGLAGDGAALELGIGTGRIALPLAARGVSVHGIDLSRAMVARLRAKPGGDAVGVTIGDFATTRVPGEFSVAYLVFNTIMNLTTQAEQVACFRNAAAHLRPGGCFVIEVGVPALRQLPHGQTVVPFHGGATNWAYDVYDVATQAMSSNYVDVTGGRGAFRSIPFRYVWPSELDLMAEMAGMRLRERWSDWAREPFTGEPQARLGLAEALNSLAAHRAADLLQLVARGAVPVGQLLVERGRLRGLPGQLGRAEGCRVAVLDAVAHEVEARHAGFGVVALGRGFVGHGAPSLVPAHCAPQ